MTKEELINIKEIREYFEEQQKKDPELIIFLDTSTENLNWLHNK